MVKVKQPLLLELSNRKNIGSNSKKPVNSEFYIGADLLLRVFGTYQEKK